jgi:hypothetical protein
MGHFELQSPSGTCEKRKPLTLILLMWRIGWAPNSIQIYSYIQQDAKLHSLFISGNCSTCFGWYFHPSSAAHTTVSTASGIWYTVPAICRYRGEVGTGLSLLWVAYAGRYTGYKYKQRAYDHIPIQTYDEAWSWSMVGTKSAGRPLKMVLE